MNILRASRFLLSLGVRLDPVRLIRATVLMLTGYVAAPLTALALGHFTDEALTCRCSPSPPSSCRGARRRYSNGPARTAPSTYAAPGTSWNWPPPPAR